MKAKNIYISGKITSVEKEAAKLFTDAELELIDMGFIPVNPFKLNHNHNKSWLNYMKEDIKALIECDGIYMLKNYKQSKGAMIELDIAKGLGLKIIKNKNFNVKTKHPSWVKVNDNKYSLCSVDLSTLDFTNFWQDNSFDLNYLHIKSNDMNTYFRVHCKICKKPRIGILNKEPYWIY